MEKPFGKRVATGHSVIAPMALHDGTESSPSIAWPSQSRQQQGLPPAYPREESIVPRQQYVSNSMPNLPPTTDQGSQKYIYGNNQMQIPPPQQVISDYGQGGAGTKFY